MKIFSYENVELTSGYLFDKQELNRKTTINSVYDRFYESGRIGAFDFDYRADNESAIKPHIFWDSDVAKWMESAAYIIKKHPTPELEEKVETLITKIKEHQGEDGYFNIYFTVVEPENRFKNRDKHELYCAGHLMEAAVAYAEATGREEFLTCMEKYADCISKAFITEKTAEFATPGHEEIELALLRMYRYTKNKKYLDMATYFINTRGAVEEQINDEYNQTHLPVRQQKEAVGHAVRALYLYTGMANLAAQTKDMALTDTCKALWNDITLRKMYVTGGLGSTRIGEAFTTAFDLPNDTAYTETCAAISLVFFGNAMLALDNNAKYADTVERALYNGVLSGLSLDGKSFFYTNPLEITHSEYFESRYGKRQLPRAQRVECFSCSCCPPNMTRLLASLGSYIYGKDGDTLFVNQFISSELNDAEVRCKQTTSYPNDGKIKLVATGAKHIAVRIPSWCDSFTLNKLYRMENGYAIIENDGDEIVIYLDIAPRAVFADSRVIRDSGRMCVMRGPVVYCAEGVDNADSLHSFTVPCDFSYTEQLDPDFGLYTLDISCRRRLALYGALYSNQPPKTEPAVLHLIPYSAFANRGESDMLVWLCTEK